MVNPSGRIFYKDHYDTLYRVEWDTVGSLVDFTTVIMQPYVWGKGSQGYVLNNVLFRFGIITINRQVIRPIDGGYEIVAEGSSQYQDYIQMNFPCEEGPTDPFKYHLDNAVSDEVTNKVTIGPRWADPDDSDDADMLWGDINDDGSEIDLTSTNLTQVLEWVDVWGN